MSGRNGRSGGRETATAQGAGAAPGAVRLVRQPLPEGRPVGGSFEKRRCSPHFKQTASLSELSGGAIRQ
jgi:hypothetical protein